MNNSDIRIAMIQANIKQYEVAREIGISEAYFCKKLRYELLQEEKERILQVIRKLQN